MIFKVVPVLLLLSSHFAYSFTQPKNLLNSIEFSELVHLSDVGHGVNKSGIYALKKQPDKKLFVKKLIHNDPSYDSLILSYLASRILNLMCPGQGPIVIPVHGFEVPLIASYEMKTFQGGVKGERGILLDIVLDLMDISDRHEGNIGSVLIKDKRIAAIVDIDMYGEFELDWSDKFNSYESHYHEFLSALKTVASFSDETVQNVLEYGVSELGIALEKDPLRRFYDIDFIVDHVLLRLQQMRWLSTHLDTVIDLNKGEDIQTVLKTRDLSHDEFGWFLKYAVKQNSKTAFSFLLAHGSKDLSGRALEAAAMNNNQDMFEALLKQKASFPREQVLELAARVNNMTMVKSLVGLVKDSRGRALAAAVGNENILMINLLLEKGACDPEGTALRVAVGKENIELVSLLLAHGSQDPAGRSLISASRKGYLPLVNILLQHGIRDQSGAALTTAVSKGDLKLFTSLVSFGLRDTSGSALEKAKSMKQIEMIRMLENLP